MEYLITLRKFSDNDILLLEKWLYMPHVAAWFHNPLSWIHEIENRKDKFSWIHHFIVEHEKTPIGFCQYYEYVNSGETWHGDIEMSGTYSIDYMIGEVSFLKKGFGKAIVKMLIQKIKFEDNVKRVIVQPEPENKVSCNTLTSCGFCFDKINKLYLINL